MSQQNTVKPTQNEKPAKTSNDAGVGAGLGARLSSNLDSDDPTYNELNGNVQALFDVLFQVLARGGSSSDLANFLSNYRQGQQGVYELVVAICEHYHMPVPMAS
jgi:hypothetical protein